MGRLSVSTTPLENSSFLYYKKACQRRLVLYLLRGNSIFVEIQTNASSPLSFLVDMSSNAVTNNLKNNGVALQQKNRTREWATLTVGLYTQERK